MSAATQRVSSARSRRTVDAPHSATTSSSPFQKTVNTPYGLFPQLDVNAFIKDYEQRTVVHAVRKWNEPEVPRQLQKRALTRPDAVAQPAQALQQPEERDLATAVRPLFHFKPSMSQRLASRTRTEWDPLSARDRFSFSSPPACYPYRYDLKPDYQLPHMPQSLSTYRSPTAQLYPAIPTKNGYQTLEF